MDYLEKTVAYRKLPIFYVNRRYSFASAILAGLDYCKEDKSAFGFHIFFANNEKSIRLDKTTGAPISAFSFYRGTGKEKNHFYIMGQFGENWVQTPYILPGKIKKDILTKNITGSLAKVFDFVAVYKSEIEKACY